MSAADVKDPRLVAAIELLRRSGARTVQIRYDDDPQPTVWVVDAEWSRGGRDCAGALDPVTAAVRLCETVLDGATCAHCGRGAGVSDDWTARLPLPEHVCWYQFDPELETFRRGCEGQDRTPVGRNDPCPCGSGAKFKKCCMTTGGPTM